MLATFRGTIDRGDIIDYVEAEVFSESRTFLCPFLKPGYRSRTFLGLGESRSVSLRSSEGRKEGWGDGRERYKRNVFPLRLALFCDLSRREGFVSLEKIGVAFRLLLTREQVGRRSRSSAIQIATRREKRNEETKVKNTTASRVVRNDPNGKRIKSHGKVNVAKTNVTRT